MRRQFLEIKILLVLTFLISCTSKEGYIQKIYVNRNKILNEFRSQSVFRGRGDGPVSLYTYRQKERNQYTFASKENSHYFLLGDTVGHIPDSVLLAHQVGKSPHSKKISVYVRDLLKTMDEYRIQYFSGELTNVGIDLKIFMQEGNAVILYVSDTDNIKLPIFRAYLKSMHRFDANWYYTMDDH